MFERTAAFLLVSVIAVGAANSALQTSSPRETPCVQEHDVWASQALERIESIKPGMTREELLKVFRTEGGLSTGLHRTFVSRDCSYFKVDVEFQAVGRPERDSNGRVTLEESGRDIIAKISRPYLQFSVAD